MLVHTFGQTWERDVGYWLQAHFISKVVFFKVGAFEDRDRDIPVSEADSVLGD